MTYRVTVEERKVKYNGQQESVETWEVTHEVRVPDAKTTAGVMRSIADQLDPPKSAGY